MATVRLPLEGIMVVAIEQAVAAPFCTARLADAGARVIKIERPEGDFARGYDDVAAGQSSYFVWLNRGKESLVVDLAKADGKETLRGLLAQADIFVQNLKPGALGRLGFGSNELKRTWPRLIACSISGYGETGPMASRKAYDLLIQAESGLSSITGGPDEPARVGISMVDIATGATAYSAILEGSATTSEGADKPVSMLMQYHPVAPSTTAKRRSSSLLDRSMAFATKMEDIRSIHFIANGRI
jgi:crotonobetainyl-CoA:carnitine CoA-transferase CaiB-like acyl-CoA transferase